MRTGALSISTGHPPRKASDKAHGIRGGLRRPPEAAQQRAGLLALRQPRAWVVRRWPRHENLGLPDFGSGRSGPGAGHDLNCGGACRSTAWASRPPALRLAAILISRSGRARLRVKARRTGLGTQFPRTHLCGRHDFRLRCPCRRAGRTRRERSNLGHRSIKLGQAGQAIASPPRASRAASSIRTPQARPILAQPRATPWKPCRPAQPKPDRARRGLPWRAIRGHAQRHGSGQPRCAPSGGRRAREDSGEVRLESRARRRPIPSLPWPPPQRQYRLPGSPGADATSAFTLASRSRGESPVRHARRSARFRDAARCARPG